MSMTEVPGRIRPERASANDDFNWDAFDSASYVEHNYAESHQNDLKFVARMRDFFVKEFENRPGVPRGIDVGAGANLYPSLSMLPFCRELTLIDYAATNVKWLEDELKSGYTATWDPFWKILSKHHLYDEIEDPRLELASKALVQQGSVFHLDGEEWDMGTMFFVAESLTERIDEFHGAVASFMHALKPGAPFVAAFMENSTGYSVDDQPFPAVQIRDTDVRDSLEPWTQHYDGYRLDVGKAIRPGYTGMILVCGKKKN